MVSTPPPPVPWPPAPFQDSPPPFLPPPPPDSVPTDDNNWDEIQLWPAILCAALFLAITLVNLGLTYKTRTWFMLWVTFSGCSEAAGYSARAWVHYYPETDPVTAMQCFLIITPIFLCMVDYVCIGKLLDLAEDPEKARLFGFIRPAWIARFFFASDIACIAGTCVRAQQATAGPAWGQWGGVRPAAVLRALCCCTTRRMPRRQAAACTHA